MKQMTLQRRFLLQNLLLVGGLLACGGVSLWRLGILRREVDVSGNVYAEVRTIRNVGIETGIARGLLTEPQANHESIVTHLKYAVGGLDQFIQVGQGYGPDHDSSMKDAYVPIDQSAVAAREKLQNVLESLSSEKGAPADAAALRKTVDAGLDDLDRITSSCIQFISNRQQAASADLGLNLSLIGTLSAAAVAAAVLLSVGQHRLVMAPLRRLRQGVRQVASAHFAQRLDPRSMGKSPEFAELAMEFNRMAGELDEFYQRLEERVRVKSRELVRSERLASVGFLAAGVAHEINNPLNIISGYAELTVRQLEPSRQIPDHDLVRARESLQIIRDEAFRCKEITEKLLSLARNGSDSRQTLDLVGVARDVAAMIKGLRPFRDCRLTLVMSSDEPLEVEANLTEMKQVLLNLTINALESVSPGNGEVRIEGRREDDWVELSVSDNGRGMTPDVLRHVFEPFFTARRGNGDRGPTERGTGLGLSITHAIIESHEGRIRAESDGPGRGSRFTVQLPSRAPRRQRDAALTPV